MINSGLSFGNMKLNKHVGLFILLGVFFIAVVIADLITGTVHIPVQSVIGMIAGTDHQNPVWSTILFEFRIPKTLTAIMAGCALSVSGLQMQTIFRNPLAGPDVLGVSSGASLGVAFVVMGFGESFIINTMGQAGSWLQIIAAWTGAGIVLL